MNKDKILKKMIQMRQYAETIESIVWKFYMLQYHKFKMNQYYREKKEKNGKYKNELNR